MVLRQKESCVAWTGQDRMGSDTIIVRPAHNERQFGLSFPLIPTTLQNLVVQVMVMVVSDIFRSLWSYTSKKKKKKGHREHM